MKIKKGICPVCSQPVDVIPNGISAIVCERKLSQHNESPLHFCINPEDPENYLVTLHAIGGWACKGVSCTPEKILG
jgi:hypothetical protein